MSLIDQLAGVLQKYAVDQPEHETEIAEHYGQVADAAPKTELADGMAAAFRSDKTPDFELMVSQLFGQSNNEQRAGLLNTLMGSLGGAGGADVLAKLASAAGIALPAGGAPLPQVTPEQAGQVSAEVVQQAAAHAEKHDPSIIDTVSSLYSQHPQLFQMLGTTALSMVMSHLATRRRQG